MSTQLCNRAAVFGLSALLGSAAIPAAAQRTQVVPENTVVHAELAREISTRTAKEGDRVAAVLDEDDRSGFPVGTRFEGVVTEVRKASDDRPAVLDVEFRRAWLPDNKSVPIRGELASLSESDVRAAADGRLESRRRGGGFDWKWVGIGAAGGAVLGEIFGDNFLKGALLGGLGGAIYGYLNRDRGDFRELVLAEGTDFGIRMNREVAFDTRPGYRFFDRTVRQRVAGARDEFQLDDATVMVDGRPVRFDGAEPLTINGTVYLPLRPVAEAARWNIRHFPGADEFVVITPRGELRGSAGETSFMRDSRVFRLDAPALRVGGDMYVPMEWLSRVAGMTVDWNRAGRRLVLTTAEGPAAVPAGQGRGIEAPIGVPPVRLEGIVAGLAGADYEQVKDRVDQYRIVDVEPLYSSEQIKLLRARLRESAMARRNQALLTDLLRDADIITNIQVVVGFSQDRRTIYVY